MSSIKKTKTKLTDDKPLSMFTFHLDIFISTKTDCLCVKSWSFIRISFPLTVVDDQLHFSHKDKIENIAKNNLFEMGFQCFPCIINCESITFKSSFIKSWDLARICTICLVVLKTSVHRTFAQWSLWEEKLPVVQVRLIKMILIKAREGNRTFMSIRVKNCIDPTFSS